MKKLLSFVIKDYRIEISYKFSLILQLVGIVLTVVILYYLSQFIDKISGMTIKKKGFSYFEFVIIGIAFVSFLRACLEGSSRQFREDQLSGTLEIISASETGNLFISAAYSSWKLIMGLIYFSLYCLTAYFLKEFPLDFFKGLNAVVFLLVSYISIYPFVILSLSFFFYLKGEIHLQLY